MAGVKASVVKASVVKASVAVVGVAALLIGVAVTAQAQSEPRSSNRSASGIAQTDRERGKENRNQASKQHRASAPLRYDPPPAQNRAGTTPWTIEQALPGRPPAQAREAPRPAAQGLGRVPLDTGTFGVETRSQFRQNEFSDGRKIPGLETTKRDDPSYFGLSLQLPTANAPLLPLFGTPGQRQ